MKKKLFLAVFAFALIMMPVLKINQAQAKTCEQKSTYDSLAVVSIANEKDDYVQIKDQSDIIDTFLYSVNQDGYAVAMNDEKIGSIASVYTELSNMGIASALYIENETIADIVANSLSKYTDLALVAKSEVLKYARQKMPASVGIIDLREMDDIEVISVRDICNENEARNIFVNAKDVSKDKLFMLSKLLVGAWVYATDTNEAMIAVAAGCSAVVTGPVCASNLLESLPENLIVKTPVVVAHRGNTGIDMNEDGDRYPENGIKTAVDAVSKYGADAIEIDVHLSLDGKIVVMHDSELHTTTDGEGKIEELSYDSYIKNLKIYDTTYYRNKGGAEADPFAEKVPLLEEFFDALKKYDNTFLIEIKTSGTDGYNLIDETISLIKSKGFEGRVSFISFYKEELSYLRQKYSNYSVALLHSGAYSSVGEAIAACGTYNAVYSPYNNYLLEETAYEMSKRGLICSAWTYQSPSKFYTDYSFVDMLTTDSLSYISDSAKRLLPVTKKIGTSESNAIVIKANVENYYGENYMVFAKAIQVGGTGTLKQRGNAYYAEGGNVDVVYVYNYVESEAAEMNYTIMSDVIHLEMESSNGCKSMIPMACLAPMLFVGLLILRRKNSYDRV